MKSPVISFNSSTLPEYLPSIIRHPQPATDNINRCTLRINQKSKDDTSQLTDDLTQKVRNVLGHISLSIEIMESMTNDNDMKTCLDVISRSTLRINNLVREYLVNQQINTMLAEKGFLYLNT